MVNQYTYIVGEPFVIFVTKNNNREEVREKILFRLLEMRVHYNYGTDSETK